uniref:Uncharacterized protein n=1 Tax=Arundo donax TaxID=35708 RepID=A0A0A9GM92_ARUDO
MYCYLRCVGSNPGTKLAISDPCLVCLPSVLAL